MFEEELGRLDRCHSLLSAGSASMLDAIAAFDEKGLWEADGATSMTAWVAGRYGWARSTAREWVRVARALRYLPAIREAHEHGRLSFDQLKPLTRFVTSEEDDIWARKAQEMTPAQLWAEAHRRERISRQQAENDAQLRYLWMGWDDDRRFLHLEGSLPAEQGAVIEAALERRGEEVVVEEGVLDPHGARLADALVELVSSSGEGAAGPCVVVHADVAVLGELRRPRPLVSPRPSRECAWPRRPSAGWPATRRLSGWWRPEGSPSASGGARGAFHPGCCGCCAIATGVADSQDAAGAGGSRLTTCTIGVGAGRQTSTTSCCCAMPTTASSTRAAGG